ncbi:MAG: hypothetical protein U0800_06940 [Isosphaeraceae bacterium]
MPESFDALVACPAHRRDRGFGRDPPPSSPPPSGAAPRKPLAEVWGERLLGGADLGLPSPCAS